MSTENNTADAVVNETVNPVDTTPVENVQTEADKVAYETYRKSVDAEKKAKARSREQEAELEKYRAADLEREQKELEAKGEYQTIISARDQKIAEQQAKIEEIASRQSESIRKQAFLSQLPATLLHPDYISFADLKSIGVDPETGQVDSVSLQAAKDRFLKSHSSLLKPQGSTPPTTQAPTANVNVETGTKSKLSAKERLRQQLTQEQNR